MMKVNSVNTIEIYGLCGVGKSTIIKKLKLLLEEQQSEISILEPQQNECLPVKLEIFHIIKNALVLAPVQISKFILQTNARRWLLNKLAYRSIAIKQYVSNCYLLVDCGYYQPFVTYAIEIQKLEQKIPVNTLLSVLPLPRAALYFKADKKIAQLRYQDRQKDNPSRLNRANYDEFDLSSLFAKGEKVCENIHNYLKDKKIKVYVIETEKNVNDDYLKLIIQDMTKYIRNENAN
jgi:thymidylate kinase